MELELKKKPQNVIIIEGFPGFGLVGTIATEFLVEHLKCELIGKYWFEDLPATVAIHDNKVVEPIGVFYNKKYNLVIIHSISGATGIEWNAAGIIVDIAKKLKAKELISIEGVGSMAPSENIEVFYYSNKDINKKKFEKIKVKPLKEGIIMGVTASLLLKSGSVPTSCLFAETHSAMPDSKAAAKVIETLDQYLNLKVDYKPLLAQAEKFEEKLKNLLQKGAEAEELKEKKQLSYVG